MSWSSTASIVDVRGLCSDRISVSLLSSTKRPTLLPLLSSEPHHLMAHHLMDFSQKLPQRRPRFLYFTHAIILLLITSATSTNSSDRTALLSFKSLISDPSGALASWNNTTTLHFCRWTGVTCGSSQRHRKRVTALELDSSNLTGSLSPNLSNLTFLRKLDLSANQLQGQIPQELGRLFRLQHLNLSSNSLRGEIPLNLSHCSALQLINLGNNDLVGPVPVQLGLLSNLLYLNLGENSLSGQIPPSLGNITSLTNLLLHNNNLEGFIPYSLGRLKNLRIFQVSFNRLSGEIPSSLYNISSIQYFVVGNNELIGTIPPNVFNTLSNLQMILLYGNRFSGQIPSSLSNASKLVEIDLKDDSFSGAVPSNLGGLKDLYWVNFNGNFLEARQGGGWDFLTSLTNCTRLGTLGLNDNRLGGILPSSIANLSSHMDILALGGNQIYGTIPDGIGNLANLSVLLLNGNRLTGIVPPTIGGLWKLYALRLSGNNFTGQIPYSFGNFTELNQLDLRGSGLEGSIPPSFGNCRSLEQLDLSRNKFSGDIPKELLGLTSLSVVLDLSQNYLTGALPPEVGELKQLSVLDISENRLSGEIPGALGDCQSLESLYLEGNFFNGTIPQALSRLKGLQELDLSSNNLSGIIPEFLGKLGSLLYLNLSLNEQLEGEVPKQGVFRNASGVSVRGNNKLCGGIPALHLQACYMQSSSKKNQISSTLKIFIAVTSSVLGLIILLLVFAAFRWKKKKKNSRKELLPTLPADMQFMRISYAELERGTNGFSSSNLIGTGSFGSVYKGIIHGSNENNIVAVKVVNLEQNGTLKSFMAECEALRSIRHRNLIRVLTTCSGVDSRGNDFKALVLEFMPKGSLEEWLHPEVSELTELRSLSLVQRLNIAIDVACALEYLHHHAHVPIVHCDLKPSNVLLDEDMCAHVGDFGLARFLSDEVPGSNECSGSSIGIKGSIGYIAPEYGMGRKITTHGDVFSYGILLLEMFTGKRPTDDIFKDGLGLRKHVEMAFPDRILDVIDPYTLSPRNEQKFKDSFADKIENYQVVKQECLASVLGIGLSCSKESPRERMEMGNVVKKMVSIKEKLLASGTH